MVRAHLHSLVLGGIVLLASQLHADPNGTPAPAPAEASPTAVPQTPAERQARAEQIRAEVADDVRHGEVAHTKAKASRDVLKLNCVNDGMLITKQLANVVDDNRAKLDKAIAANDTGAQQGAMQNLLNAQSSASSSRHNIDNCVGGSESTTTGPNGTKLTVQHPTVLDNPTADCNNLGVSNCMTQKLEYVAFASPFSPD